MTRFFSNLLKMPGKAIKKGAKGAKKVAKATVKTGKAAFRTVAHPIKTAKDVGKAAIKVGKKIGDKIQNNDFLSGTPDVYENVSSLLPEQQPLLEQSINAGLAPGAGGATGQAADYYRNALGGQDTLEEDYNALQAPLMRQYREQIMPDLAEQFAGMGAGAMNSSGFQNAAIGAGTDLTERLASMRAGLRQNQQQYGLQAADRLNNIGQQPLQNYSDNRITEQGREGILSQIIPAATAAGAAYFGAPPAVGAKVGDAINNAAGFGQPGAQQRQQPLPQVPGINLPNWNNKPGTNVQRAMPQQQMQPLVGGVR